MPGEKVTSLDVAELAGVSQSAVSRYFTPGGSVSKRMAEKIKAAAETLGYRPNVLARSLITGRSRIIGLVVAYLDNYFYPDVIERLSVALQKEGYHVLVFMGSPTVGDVQGVVREILDYQIDGLVLASVSLSSRLADECRALGVPVVLVNRDQDDPRLSCVITDNRKGGHAIARHLVEIGRSRIAYIAGFEGASTQRDRERGFKAGLKAAGAALYGRGLGNFEQERARAAAREMFAGSDRPDAVFVCNDHMAFAVMDVLRSELGLRVPEDVAVAGFDDVKIASWPAYALTTYRQPVDAMVAETVTTLTQRIGTGEAESRRVILEGSLVIRASTGISLREPAAVRSRNGREATKT